LGISGIARRDKNAGPSMGGQWGGLAEGAESVARTFGFELSGDLGFDMRNGSEDTILM